MGRKGVVGELLVVIVLLASVFLLVSTFSDRQDVPNVPKESLEALRDVKTLLSKAIIAWLDDGVLDDPLVCNGLYPVEEGAFIESLEPYIIEELETALPEGNLQVKPGTLSNVSFDRGSLRITLSNGSIIYDDGTIYSEDLFDKEYLFNVRLPLALQVVEDWARCDAGNLSRNLRESIGRSCFFGKKNPQYGGASGNTCLKQAYTITPADREYMLRYGITREDVAAAAEISVDQLNSYFGGEASCVAPMLGDDAGITCDFRIEDLELEYKMAPWSSEEIIVSPELDHTAFMSNDDHVHRISPEVIAFPQTDDQLDCAAGEREEIVPSIPTVPYYVGPQYVDVATGKVSIYANPVLYVNTSRGARFNLVVACKDSRAALLGQPLEYTFTIRQGINQHCGPTERKGARHRCGACNPMPATDLAQCITPDKKSCDAYYPVCAEGVVWEFLNENPSIPRTTYSDIIKDRPELRDRINQSCGTVPGYESEYPRPTPPSYPPPVGWDACPDAYGAVCCMATGFNAERKSCSGIGDPECRLGKDEIVNLCYGPAGCKATECYESSCNDDYECVEDVPKPEGTACGDKSICFACLPGEGSKLECQFVEENIGKTCTLGSKYENDCKTFTCQYAESGVPGCLDVINPDMVGKACTTGDDGGFCMKLQCSTVGSCGNVPDNVGEGCGTREVRGPDQTCTYNAKCSDDGFCEAYGKALECELEGGGTCTCSLDESGCPVHCRT